MGQMQTEKREHIKLTNVNCPWKPFLAGKPYFLPPESRFQTCHMCHPRSLGADKAQQNLGDKSSSVKPKKCTNRRHAHSTLRSPPLLRTGTRRQHINAAVFAVGKFCATAGHWAARAVAPNDLRGVHNYIRAKSLSSLLE